MKNNRETRLILGIALSIVLFLSVNIFASGALTGVKLDLTEDKLFTLSDSTKQVLSDLDEPITLRLYLSKDLLQSQPDIANFSQRVEEMLRRYEDLSGGMISVEVLDPEPFSEVEDRAVAFGLRGLPVGATQDQAYFGLAATNSTDDEDLVPFFDPAREAFLEYDLTKLVYGLANPQKTVIGVLTSLQVQGDFRRQQDPWVMFDQMKQFFDVEFLDPAADVIGDDISVLLVAHPKGLPPQTLVAVDRYVRSGGQTILFFDPHSEIGQSMEAQMTGRPSPDTASDLGPLLSGWGLEIDRNLLVGDAGSARRVQAQDGTRPVITDYITWLGLDAQRFDESEVSFAQLERLNLASAGHLALAEGSDLSLTPLLQSSANAMLVQADAVRMEPDPLTLIRNFESTETVYTLAGRVSGIAGDPFEDGLPDGVEAATFEPKPINLLVFTDADMLADTFWVRVQDFFGEKLTTPIAHNAALVLNLLEELSGGVQISDLRGRGLSVRRFEVVEELQAEAEVRFRAEEQRLLDKITDVESQLTEMRTLDEGAEVALTDAQEAALDQMEAELLQSRRELRDVQHNLLSDIEALEADVRMINIFAMPVLVALFAFGLAVVRRKRAQRRAAI